MSQQVDKAIMSHGLDYYEKMDANPNKAASSKFTQQMIKAIEQSHAATQIQALNQKARTASSA